MTTIFYPHETKSRFPEGRHLPLGIAFSIVFGAAFGRIDTDNDD